MLKSVPRVSPLPASTKEQFKLQLREAAETYGFQLQPAQADKLLAYLELLIKWNHTYNLTAIRDPKQMLGRHLIDSLSIVPYIEGQHILDVGTGPGLPGIPLAILFPEIEFQLLDSNVKKTRFLTQCKIELGLNNIQISHCRVEDVHFKHNFDQIVSRAFTSLDSMVDLCAHLLAEKGKFLAMKGIEPEQEAEAISQLFEVEKTIQLNVPACEGQRHLIIIGKSA